MKHAIYLLGSGITAKGLSVVTGLGVITLQGIKGKPAKIGSEVPKKKLIGPKTTILFADSKAVLALAVELIDLAHRMEIKDAANDLPARRVNKQRKVSKKRTR